MYRNDSRNPVATDPAADALLSVLAGLGIAPVPAPGDTAPALADLLRTSASVIQGLAQQADGIRAQRDALGGATAARFWSWDVARSLIRIEAAASARGASQPGEIASWSVIAHPDDGEALAGIARFLSSGENDFRTTLSLRADDGQWKKNDWRGRVTRRAADGSIGHLAGVLSESLGPGDQATIERLQAANRAKTDFLANISHEIRTPMTAIVGAAGLAFASAAAPEQQELARTIKSSAEALLAILDQTLDYATIEASGVVLEPAEFQPAALITETARIFALAGSRKQLDFSLRIAPDVPSTLIADPVRLRQIVGNLLNNAIKFTEQGTIALNVEARRGAGRHCLLRITVRDTGIGIPSEKQELVFAMFSQADASTRRRYGGTGIGLSICRRLAEAMGGRISLRSQPGHGSSFRVDIAAALPERDFPEKDTKPPLLAGTSVLILERCRERYAVLAEQIEHLGGRPIHACGVGQAEEILAAATADGQPFAAIFVDSDSIATTPRTLAARWSHHCAGDAQRLFIVRPLSAAGETASADSGTPPCLFRPFSILELLERLRPLTGRNRPPEALVLDPPDPAAFAAARCEEKSAASLRVLLAEDNPVSRKVLASILQRAGIDVLAVDNGAEALAAFERESTGFGLVLMDIQMPVMDGFEAAEAIRACEERRTWVMQNQWRSTPILALTADALGDIAARCRDAGMNEVLLKPATPERLLAAIRRLAAPPAASRTGDPAPDRPARADSKALQLGAIATIKARLNPAQLDLDTPLSWSGGDPGELQKLVRSFLEELPPFVGELESLLAQSAFAEATRRLHRTKSALRILGATESAQLSETLSLACRQQNAADCARIWSLLKESLGQLQRQLRLLVQTFEALAES